MTLHTLHPDIPLSLREYFARRGLTKAEQFAGHAASCYNAKFVDKGRDPATGLDCAGLIAYSLSKARIPFEDKTNYTIRSTEDRYGVLLKELRKTFRKVRASSKWEVGDVAIYHHALCKGHVRILLPFGFFVHAEDNKSVERVAISSMEPDWAERLANVGGEFSVWRLK